MNWQIITIITIIYVFISITITFGVLIEFTNDYDNKIKEISLLIISLLFSPLLIPLISGGVIYIFFGWLISLCVSLDGNSDVAFIMFIIWILLVAIASIVNIFSNRSEV